MAANLRRLRRRARGAALNLAARAKAGAGAPLPDLGALERVLLVFVNFRLGNTVLATPGVAALAEALPKAELDFLGGPAAPAVMRGQRLGRIFTVSRGDLLAPWRLAWLAGRLRRRRYQAAIHLSPASSSLGGLLLSLSGAPHRIGCRRREGNVYFTTLLDPPRARHKVDQLRELLAQLGVACPHERQLRFADDEVRGAERFLAERLGPGSGPVVALFVGARARRGKGWPLATAAAVLAGVRGRGAQPIVFLGPEEAAREAEIRAALGPAHFVRDPDLRRVAALLSRCAAVVTPDAGPMHLAIAAGAPTVAVFRRLNADKWGPRPPRGAAVVDPSGSDATAVLAALDRCLDTGA